jgi:hypothetical protein
MKWSQAICVSILVDGLYPIRSVDGRKPRFGDGLSVTALGSMPPAICSRRIGGRLSTSSSSSRRMVDTGRTLVFDFLDKLAWEAAKG